MYPAVLAAVELVGFAGVIVGPVPKTSAPDPVSSVTVEIKLEEEGVVKNV